jgi:hypothetical protein
MKMSQYPAAIAQAAQVVNELDSQIAAVGQHIARLEGNADRVAAFEQGLKNDNQRRARRFELLCVDQEYQTAQNTLMRLMSEKAVRSLTWNICVTSLAWLSWKQEWRSLNNSLVQKYVN